MKRIRIAHVQLLPLLSGVQRVTLETFKRLDRDRFDLSLVCKEPGPLSEAAEAMGIRCHFIGHLHRRVRPIRDIRALGSLYRLFRRERFDIVHTHSSKTGVIGRVAARLARVPAVLHTVHGFSFAATSSRFARAFYGAMEWVGARCSDRIIFLNPVDQETGRRRLRVTGAGCLMPNGVDTKRFAPREAKEVGDVKADVLNLPTAAPVVAMIGRLSPQKNPLLFVEAAAMICEKHPDALFLVIGDGELRQDVERAIREKGLTERIRLLGWRDDVERILPAVSVLVHPSLWEGLPLNLLEAHACGVPVVATDIPGNQHVIRDGEDGYLVPPGDTKAIQDAVCQLLDDDDKRSAFGASGRRKILEKHDVEHRTEALDRLYTELVSNGVK